MKKTILFLLALAMLWGCKKEEGNLVCTVKFTSSINKSMTGTFKHMQTEEDADKLYTQFGDYITSITPYKFSTKIMSLQFSDNKVIFDGGHKIQLIHGETLNDDPQRYADFSNNTIVSFIPSFSGGTNEFFDLDEIAFIYFEFGFWYLSQELIIPDEYNEVNLSQFNGSFGNSIYSSDSVKQGNVLKVDHFPLYDKMFDYNALGVGPHNFIFGNTDSTRIIYLYEGLSIPELDAVCNCVMTGPINPFVWSNRYEPFALSKPPEGEDVTVNTTVGFNTTNLIQIYAGADNIQYTSDDIFVYAPNFWERIYVNVLVE